ncbi:hypothetical protein PG993_006795 [Apiospora rasikravindrae]|uniref:Uncharacterized protein n=1 Tax=Apiospora rasikravindrae TaxID=990691 RepID=A0ABR1T6R2_9PEZI
MTASPPVKLDRHTKWEQVQIRKVRKKRRAYRRRGLDRKLAHTNFDSDNMQDNESEDSLSDDEGEEDCISYDFSDECDGFDPDCCYCALVRDLND